LGRHKRGGNETRRPSRWANYGAAVRHLLGMSVTIQRHGLADRLGKYVDKQAFCPHGASKSVDSSDGGSVKHCLASIESN